MKNIKSFVVDFVLWFYISITSYKIVWQRIIIEDRYADYIDMEGYICVISGLILSSSLYLLKGFSWGKSLYFKDEKNETVSLFKQKSNYIFLLAFLLTLISGWIITEVSILELFSKKGFDQAGYLFSQLLSPQFSILKKVILVAIETIYMAFMATFFAIPIAFLLSFFSAKNIMKGTVNSGLYFLIRLVMNFTRSIEPLIWAIIFSVWVGIGPFAGMLALTIHSIVSLAKLYSEQIEEIDNGPVEAIKATGASNILVVWYGVVPQIINPFLSYTIYRWDINVRMATIIGMVGGGGIGNLLMQYQGMARWNEVGTIVFIIAIIVWVMDFGSAKIREKLTR